MNHKVLPRETLYTPSSYLGCCEDEFDLDWTEIDLIGDALGDGLILEEDDEDDARPAPAADEDLLKAAVEVIVGLLWPRRLLLILEQGKKSEAGILHTAQRLCMY